MFENGPSDRMHLLGIGDLRSPGGCIVCGNGTCDQGYVDLGVVTEWEGQVYLCWFCTAQAAEVIKCLVPDEARELIELSQAISTDAAELRLELEAARERLKIVDAFLGNLNFPDAGLSSSISDDASEDKQSEQPATDSAEPDKPEDSTESAEPVKVTKSRRVAQSSVLDKDGDTGSASGFKL